MASTSQTAPSLPVVFTTRTQYPLPSQKFMIPSTWKRYQLSQLINKALSLAKIVPFDFLIHGDVLRGSLGEWTAEKGVGEEETLEIEYIESIMPPQRMSALPHEDWVSSISCRLQGLFLTASYDGNIRAFDYSQKLLHTVPAHGAAITHLCSIPDASSPADTHLIATTSHDLTARLTRLTLSATPTSEALATLHLHTAPLSSVAANAAGTHLLTSSWDSLIGLWDTSVPESDEVPREQVEAASERKKRRRVDEEHDRPKRKAPLGVLKSHTARVARVLFGHEAGQAVSAGFDSTVRVWDVENGICTNTITASEKPFVALTLPSAESYPHTALAASTDRTATLFDLRSSSITAASKSFVHPATPSSLAFAPGAGAHQFVSGAYDGVVRLWDLRSAGKEMASFKVWEGQKKVLDVDWAFGLVGIAGEGGVEVWKVAEEQK